MHKKEKSCLDCIHFCSYQQRYEDELEPHDSGICEIAEYEGHTNDVHVNEYDGLECDDFLHKEEANIE